jgi:hypothetical protein
MAEQIAFPAPIAPPSPTVFRVALLVLDAFNERIIVDLRDWNGTTFGSIVERVMETGPVAVTLMVGLNKANLTTKSLHTRALEWALATLVTRGKATAGTISGTVP